MSETGPAQTVRVAEAAADARAGLAASETVRQGGHRVRNQSASRTLLEGATGAGESPVGEGGLARHWNREYGGAREIPSEAGWTTIQG